jgi:adenosylcobinamide-GDP ribazoletransferase
MCLAPFVALVLSAICGLPLLISHDRPILALLLGAIAFALLAWATRALHLDGLADTADALGSGKPAEQALEIARKSDIGPFGVISLFFVLLIDIISVASFEQSSERYLAFVLAIVTSRIALTWACTRAWPAARPDGLGAMVASSVPLVVALAWTALGFAFGWWLLGSTGAISVVMGLIAGAVILSITRRRLGGITGDVLGATIEVSAAACLVALAFL